MTGLSTGYPYAKEILRHVELGISNTPYAWHGTSTEAIIHLAKTGCMPVSGSFNNKFFYAPEYMKPGEQRSCAAMYANHNADKLRALARLSFVPLDMEEFMHVLMDLGPGDSVNRFIGNEINPIGEDPAEVLKILREEIGRTTNSDGQGVAMGTIIGIDAQIAQDYVEEFGYDDHVAITFPEGTSLPIKYITGIEPQTAVDLEMILQL